MEYAVKPGTRCHVCKHEQLMYERYPSRYSGQWRKFVTTRSLHFAKPVLCVGDTYYFVNGEWMMRVELPKDTRRHKVAIGVSRLPEIKLKTPSDFKPKQRIRSDSEK